MVTVAKHPVSADAWLLCDWAIWKRILFSIRPDNLFPRWRETPIYRKSRNE